MAKALPVVFGYLSAAFWILNFRPFITKFAPAAGSIHADGLACLGLINLILTLIQKSLPVIARSLHLGLDTTECFSPAFVMMCLVFRRD